MNKDYSCDSVSETGMIERYVAGTLSGKELEGFEAHLIECKRCQDEVVPAVAAREGLGLRAGEGLESEDPPANTPDGEKGARQGFSSPRVWLPLAAAAVVAGLVFFGPEGVPEDVSALGGVSQAPVYLGVSVRQEEVLADSLFDAAMLHYVVDEFQRAATGLESALESGADDIPARFFLGASYLMVERPRDAAEAFAAVIGFGDSPYLAEAHFYSAKALLQMGEVGPALSHLGAAAALSGEISSAADVLADSLEAQMGG